MAKEHGSPHITTAPELERLARELIVRTLGQRKIAYTDLDGIYERATHGGRLDREEKAIARAIGLFGETASEGGK